MVIPVEEFKVISVDMFQTLVDVNSRRHQIWREILGEAYTYELAEEYWACANELVFKYFNDLVYDKDFVNVKTVFAECYKELFDKKDINADSKKAAGILARQHGFSKVYEDSVIFLKEVSKKYPVCLISDSDSDMILPLLKLFDFDKVFISEDYQSYKFQAGSKIFDEVIRCYDVLPKNILHIGDGQSDVFGAKSAGLKTCWLNRKDRVWNDKIRPDYEIKSLLELFPLLGVNVTS